MHFTAFILNAYLKHHKQSSYLSKSTKLYIFYNIPIVTSVKASLFVRNPQMVVIRLGTADSSHLKSV